LSNCALYDKKNWYSYLQLLFVVHCIYHLLIMVYLNVFGVFKMQSLIYLIIYLILYLHVYLVFIFSKCNWCHVTKLIWCYLRLCLWCHLCKYLLLYRSMYPMYLMLYMSLIPMQKYFVSGDGWTVHTLGDVNRSWNRSWLSLLCYVIHLLNETLCTQICLNNSAY
jgi:hypothetical protein